MPYVEKQDRDITLPSLARLKPREEERAEMASCCRAHMVPAPPRWKVPILLPEKMELRFVGRLCNFFFFFFLLPIVSESETD